MVVCSRVKDYEALTERLRLSSAICIKPLSQQQVYSFLAKAGDSLTGLKKLLQQDIELEQFVQTPLILNIMSLAYQDWSAEDLLKQFRSSEDRYRHLFDSYIERMLRRRVIGQLEPNSNSAKYSQEKVLHWLSWLAKTMVNESKTIFLIEKMQPTLLQSQSERISYRISNFLISELSIALIWGLIGGLIGGFRNRLIFGLRDGLILGLMFGLIGGLIVGLSREIMLFEQMSWSWQRAKSRLIRELGSGVILGLILGLIIVWLEKGLTLIERLMWGLMWGLMFGLIVGLIFGLSSGLGGAEVEQRTIPNQGIKSSAKNFAIVVLSVGLIVGLILGLIFVGLSSHDRLAIMVNMLSFGLIFGLIFGLRYGGAACIQHFNLRGILYRKGHIPWNYLRFLDYASERLFMKKVGGGYIFYHRMLMEHFAQRHQASREPVLVTPRQTSQPVAKANTRTKVRSSNINNNLPQPSNPVQNYLVCSNCDRQNPTTGKFCTKCGSQL